MLVTAELPAERGNVSRVYIMRQIPGTECPNLHDTAGLRDDDATGRAAESPQFHAHNSIPWTPSWRQAPTAALPTFALFDMGGSHWKKKSVEICIKKKSAVERKLLIIPLCVPS